MSNVIALPTAAARKVRQPKGAAADEAAQALPRVQPTDPAVRRWLPFAETMLDARKEPGEIAMALLLALMPEMRREDKAMAAGRLTLQNSPEALTARMLLLADLHPINRRMLNAAFDELEGRE